MEYRDDLRVLLLNGLPTFERHETLATLDRMTANKLARLRLDGPQDEPSTASDDHEPDLFEV